MTVFLGGLHVCFYMGAAIRFVKEIKPLKRKNHRVSPSEAERGPGRHCRLVLLRASFLRNETPWPQGPRCSVLLVSWTEKRQTHLQPDVNKLRAKTLNWNVSI